MSINSALLAGVSGLIANSSALSSVANNIANANTVGYKTVNTQFEDLVGVSAGAGNYAAGGVQAVTQQLVSQSGSTQQTTSGTDLSITGNGMFVVTSTATPTASDTRSYTEAGSFTVDSNGYLVNAAGYYLQGFPVDETTGKVTINPSDLNTLATINVGDVGGTATPTTTVTVNQNLNSTQTVSAAAAVAGGGLTTVTSGVPTQVGVSSTLASSTSASNPATVTVTDSSGNVVYQDTNVTSLSSTGYTWSGLSTGGATEPDGLYTVSITNAAAGGGVGQITNGAVTSSTVSVSTNLATASASTPATVTVTNSSGAVVSSYTVSGLSSPSYTWPGTTDGTAGGTLLPDGAYSISITDEASTATTPYNAQSNNMASGAVKYDAQITIPIANSQGGQQTVTMDLLKSSTANQWYAEIVAPDGDIQYGSSNTTLSNNQLATGILAFNQDGSINLTDSTIFGAGDTSPTLDFGASGTTPSTATGYSWGSNLGIAAQKISLNLATSTGGITQLDSATLTQSIEADGTAFGSLNTVSIDSKGFVTATYSNGVSKQIAQVALATFSNPDGLTAVTGDAYQVSTTSGSFNLKAPGSAGAGTITPDSLEASTVDLSSQFASLITTQQAYSASAKVLTTADNMEQSLLQVIQ
jgi:flagellar hook protein FlgE